MAKRRAIIYTRVSNDPTGHARSVASQEAECRAVCEREGWTVAEVFADNDLGASRWSGVARPEYERLQATLQAGDVLVTWEASRAQRDLAAYVALRDLCAERGVLWSYSGRTYDLTRGDDRFGTGLDALIAEREADQIRERVLRGKRAAAESGRPAGRPPYGYRREFDPRTGTTTGWGVDPEESIIVREIAGRFLAGETLRGITSDLNTRGVPPPAGQKNAADRWLPRRLRLILTNPTYAGLRQHRGEIIGTASWPALIDETDWHRAQGILADPSRKLGPGPAARHLLSGLAKCGVCGSSMRYFFPKSVASPKYNCSSSRSCTARLAEPVEELVTGVILGRLMMPDAVDVFTPPGDDGHVQAVAELRGLRDRLDSFADAAADGEVSAAAYARIEARLLPQIADAEKRAATVTPGPVAELVTADDVRAAWDRLTVESKRTVVRLLVSVTVHPSTTGTRQFNPDDIEIRWK